MRVCISILGELLAQAQWLARRAGSHLFAMALREYVAGHARAAVTETLDQVVDRVGSPADPLISAAARRVLERSPW